jgi:hypothetical protein
VHHTISAGMAATREMGVEAQLARGSAPIRRNVARPRMRPEPSAIGKDENRLVRT